MGQDFLDIQYLDLKKAWSINIDRKKWVAVKLSRWTQILIQYGWLAGSGSGLSGGLDPDTVNLKPDPQL